MLESFGDARDRRDSVSQEGPLRLLSHTEVTEYRRMLHENSRNVSRNNIRNPGQIDHKRYVRLTTLLEMAREQKPNSRTQYRQGRKRSAAEAGADTNVDRGRKSFRFGTSYGQRYDSLRPEEHRLLGQPLDEDDEPTPTQETFNARNRGLHNHLQVDVMAPLLRQDEDEDMDDAPTPRAPRTYPADEDMTEHDWRRMEED
ncbi:hypothetical protein H2203_003844 [Taxawa tesnikishii (nom. ined.)]|nr:hypothetical protein H2203_003844 [Dothideales sp. JES 119]